MPSACHVLGQSFALIIEAMEEHVQAEQNKLVAPSRIPDLASATTAK
jgi:hypothetical protein